MTRNPMPYPKRLSSRELRRLHARRSTRAGHRVPRQRNSPAPVACHRAAAATSSGRAGKSWSTKLFGESLPLSFLLRFHQSDRFQLVLLNYAVIVLALTAIATFWTLGSESIAASIVGNKAAYYYVPVISGDGITHLRSWHLSRIVSALATLALYFRAGSRELKHRSGVAVDVRSATAIFTALHLTRFAASSWTIGCGFILLGMWALEHLNIVVDLTPKLAILLT